MYECPVPYCNKKFKNKRSLLIHLKKTVKECPVCYKKVTFDGLMKHLLMCKDEKHKEFLRKLLECIPSRKYEFKAEKILAT
ncbi:MAG: C2H2-type zinc finger protein [Acidianus sp.]|jgi:hypothetical protein|nr:C2H2-type zinc finger protein [Acidianus sp.]